MILRSGWYCCTIVVGFEFAVRADMTQSREIEASGKGKKNQSFYLCASRVFAFSSPASGPIRTANIKVGPGAREHESGRRDELR